MANNLWPCASEVPGVIDQYVNRRPFGKARKCRGNLGRLRNVNDVTSDPIDVDRIRARRTELRKRGELKLRANLEL